MGKRKDTDPVIDKLAALDARSLFLSDSLNIAWRLAIMVLVPIFIGVQLDKRFDTKPQLTVGAFILALVGAGYLIYKNYSDMQREQLLVEKTQKSKDAKRKPYRTLAKKRGANA